MSIKEAKLLKKLWCCVCVWRGGVVLRLCVCVWGGGGVVLRLCGGGLGILQDNLVSSTEIIT